MVRLRFRMTQYPTSNNSEHIEDFDYEFRHSDYLFDVANLELSIFAYPLPSNFNPSTQLLVGANVYKNVQKAEFHYGSVTAYKLVDGFAREVQFDDVARGHLQEVLQIVGKEAASTPYGAIPNVQRLVLGFVHDQFQSLIVEPTDGVEDVWLSDNFADITTKTKTAVFFLDFQLDGISGSDDDMEVWATNWHVYRDESGNEREYQYYPSSHDIGWAYVIRPIKPGGFTPWLRMGAWNISECPFIVSNRVRTRIVDPGVFHNTSFGPEEFNFSFDCVVLNQRVQQGEWGIVEELSDIAFYEVANPVDYPLVAEWIPIVSATARGRVFLTTR
jgi:hypothetical protein